MGKKKDKKERKRREREQRDADRLVAEAAGVVDDLGSPSDAPAEPGLAGETAPPAADSARPGASGRPLATPPRPVALEPSGPFPGVTPPAVLRRAPVRPPVPGDPDGAAGLPLALTARDVVSRLSGAALCYGEPVTVEGRTVITVGQVRAGGGLSSADDRGGGGGGVDARPLGYIELTADGSRFTPIASHRSASLGAGLALLAGAAAGVAGAALNARRRPAPTGLGRLVRRLGR